MLKKIFIICLLFSPLITVSAQTNLTEIILDGWYTGTLDNVLERISREKNLKFSYNKEYASKVKIDAPPFKRDLDNFLKYVVCHKNKLKYYIDDADVIHVVEVWKQVEEEKITRKNVSSNTVSRRNLTLSGKIIDKENSESLPFVNLFVNSTRRGSSSNGDGYFTLIDIPSDTSTITVTYIGYKPFILKLTPETDISNYIIELEQSTELLNEVII